MTSTFIIKDKPANWSNLPLCAKIKFYAKALTPEYVPYVDKLEAKKLVEGIVACAPLIRVLKDCEDVQYEDLNPDYMVKASHGCGWNISVQPLTTRDRVLTNLRQWNKAYGDHKEPLYRLLEPRFFLEEKIDCAYSGKNGLATVFYIRCIHGKPFAIGVRQGPRQNSYDVDWNPIKKPQIEGLTRPPQLAEMLEIAAKLSAPFEFVRIDLYIDKTNTIYFSEFTFTPSGGAKFYSDELEMAFGKLWL
jgi:hypothetical protein